MYNVQFRNATRKNVQCTIYNVQLRKSLRDLIITLSLVSGQRITDSYGTLCVDFKTHPVTRVARATPLQAAGISCHLANDKFS